MAKARARQELEAEARAAELAAKKGAVMRRVMVSQLYCPDKVLGRDLGVSQTVDGGSQAQRSSTPLCSTEGTSCALNK